MKSYVKKSLTVFSLFLLGIVVFAEKTPIQNVYQYRLENGLELYVAENHAVPLVTIEIAVKTGGIAQTPENAGLFHLYEHMMFKGNTKYRSAADVQNAIKKLGVTTWNGYTSDECVRYFFTIPVNQLYNGLEFWSYAVRTPLMDKAELENEKKVVLSEIKGGYSNPDTILSAGLMKALFPAAPWKLDPAGPAENVQKATVADLKSIQQTYYIPNNAALFVGGDVNPAEVYRLVKELYGSWKRAADPWTVPNKQQLTQPYLQPQYFVMPYDKMSVQTARVLLMYRGPDAEFDRADTYGADVTGYLMDDPSGVFKQMLCSVPELMIPGSDYVSEGYLTKKEGGIIQLSAVMLQPEKNLADRAKLLLNTLNRKVFPDFSDGTAVSPAKLQNVYQKLQDYRIMEMETASGLLDTLLNWWVTADAGYYYTYNENMQKTGTVEVASFVNKYFTGRNPVVVVLVNPDVYNADKQDFIDSGYTEITKENAFWWRDAK